ncbi:MAG: polyphosphate polymerase domain-containing protein [Cellulosilyticaceae bacterium]
MVKNKYRHELKYDISYAEYMVLHQKLRFLIQPDSYVDESGRYKVTSLYFDNLDDKVLREKMDGVSRREKFRLRYYNDATSNIKLEKKQKVNGLCLKTSAAISKDACERLLAGEDDWMDDRSHSLQQELDFQMKTQILRPQVLVLYEREPYVYEVGNVRVTFDMNIRTSLSSTDFLNTEVASVPINVYGRMIMEVKYDTFLPGHIQDMLQLGRARVGAFSKYAACRQNE